MLVRLNRSLVYGIRAMAWPALGPHVPKSSNPITRGLGRLVLRLMGWRMTGPWPDEPKLIVVLAPHSSNIDFILSVAVFWGLGLKTSYLAKHSLFRFPLGPIMRGLGGIPVDRRAPQGMVGQLLTQFSSREQLVVGITPEGTRGEVREWKSGFARIAVEGNIPVLPAIVNYSERMIYFQPVIKDIPVADDVLQATKNAASVGSPRIP